MDKQADLHNFWREFIYTHEFKNQAMTLLNNIEEDFGEYPNDEEAPGQVKSDMHS